LRDHANTSAPRFTYDRGTLEIMSPLPEHERFNRAIQLLVPIVVEEMGGEVYSFGSTTFKREDLLRGFEPDSCFYLQNAPRMRGKTRVDLHVDPAPDLVVEIDITHPSLDKLPIYARIGVPEVWRYDGARLEILALEGNEYTLTLRPSSRALPAVTAEALMTLLPRSMGVGDITWMRDVRAWARTLSTPGAPS
ncbi:MAG: Uma2 family endonuclease, partial [Chloroflexi bacterium]|nr:Uma2 family endonuclease [Chloroflexota bacterium]